MTRKEITAKNRENFANKSKEQRREIITKNTIGAILCDFDLGNRDFLHKQAFELGVQFPKFVATGKKPVKKRF